MFDGDGCVFPTVSPAAVWRHSLNFCPLFALSSVLCPFDWTHRRGAGRPLCVVLDSVTVAAARCDWGRLRLRAASAAAGRAALSDCHLNAAHSFARPDHTLTRSRTHTLTHSLIHSLAHAHPRASSAMASRKRGRSSSPDARLASPPPPPPPPPPSQSLVPVRPQTGHSALPGDMLFAIGDFLDLPTAAGLLARTCRAAAQAVARLDAIKGRLALQSDPALANDPALAVWRSDGGLRLLGRKSSTPGASADDKEVTLDQLRLIFPSRLVVSPRIILLRDLTTAASRANMLQLFARGQLHLHRFESHRLLESPLLHPKALEVVRSGWLSEDALFLLHEGHDQTWDACAPHKRRTMLQFLVQPATSAGAPAGARTITVLADKFLPLTTDDVDCLRARCVRAWSGVAIERAEHIRAQAARVPALFTIAAMEQHTDAWTECRKLHSIIARACTSCPCQCNSQFRSLCVCDCLPGCSLRRVAKFKEELARLGPQFIGVPPTAEQIAAHLA